MLVVGGEGDRPCSSLSGKGKEGWGVPQVSQACRPLGTVGRGARGPGGAQRPAANRALSHRGLEATSPDRGNYHNQTVDTNYAPGREAMAAVRQPRLCIS